jgi:hypothetical protein
LKIPASSRKRPKNPYLPEAEPFHLRLAFFPFLNCLFRMMRSRLFCLLLLGGILSSPQGPLEAQFKFRETPNQELPDRLNAAAGEALWEAFMAQRTSGPFRIAGTLVDRPRGAPSIFYGLVISGDWNPQAETTRIELFRDNAAPVIREVSTDAVARLDNTSRDEPLLPQLPLSPWDVVMPYLYWENRHYAGPDRFLGRPVHAFELRAPDGWGGDYTRVLVTLDEDFAALLRAEFYRDGKRVERLRIGGFKQFPQGWSFSELIWEHREERRSLKWRIESVGP